MAQSRKVYTVHCALFFYGNSALSSHCKVNQQLLQHLEPDPMLVFRLHRTSKVFWGFQHQESNTMCIYWFAFPVSYRALAFCSC